MRFSTTMFNSAASLCLLFVFSLFAQNALLDDHSDQTDTNEFGSYWFYYDDNLSVGPNDRPQADPTTIPSVINVAFTTKERHAFGDPNDKWLINDYTFTLGGESDKFATMPFTFGDNWYAPYCPGTTKCASPYVGIGTTLAPDGMMIDLSEASGVSFKIKSRSNPLEIVFKVQTYDIDNDSTFAYYQKAFTTSTAWATITIPFSDLELPDWAGDVKTRPFDKKKVTRISWEIKKVDNNTVSADTLDLDDIYINDFSYTPSDPPMLIDDFEGGYSANKIGTYWFFWDDSDSSGTSKVNNAGKENRFKGSYTPGNSSAYAGVMDFALGNGYRYPEVAMAFLFDNEKAPIDMSGATAVQFDIKGSRYMTIKFRVNQSTITDYDYYSSQIEVWPVWRTVTVYLFTEDYGIKQEPLWGIEKPFDIDKLTGLEWLYRKQDNAGNNQTGIVSIDNVKILGKPKGLKAPFPPVWISPDWKSIDNPINTVFKWNKVPDATSYKLQISKSPDFSGSFIESNPLDTQSTTTLEKGTTYYCRINASTADTTSRWSSTNIFTTLFDIPPQPTLLSPANNATAVPVSTTLLWNKAIGAATYHLQVSNSSSFSTTILDTIITADTTIAVNGLIKGTTYYWQVSATNSSGTSPLSETRNFTTVHNPPAKPTLLSPANGITRAAKDQTFSWTLSPTATTYNLQVSTSLLFSALVINDSSITTNSSAKTLPANGTKYYWRVKAKNDGGDSGWSSEYNFVTVYSIPATPILASPAENATGIPVSTILLWNGAANAISYQLQVSISNTFATTVKDTTVTDTSSVVTALNKETVYYWRVRGINPDSTGNWSTPRSFTTIINAPGVAYLILPANKAVNIPVATQLVWSKVTAATSYTVQLSTSPLFENFIVNQAVNTDTILPVNSLSNNTAYYWRVQAVNLGGTGAWSATDTFTTVMSAPGITSLIFPLDNALNQPTGTLFTWSSVNSAAGYRLIVASDSLFTQLVKDSSGITDTSIAITGLINDTKYYWQVSAINAGGNGPWSGKRNFTTIVSLPSKVILVVAASDTIKTNQTTIFWHPSTPKIAKYRIEIATNESMEGSIIDTVTDTSLQLLELTDNVRYWWRVSAANDAGWGEFSEKGSFFITIPVSIRVPERFGVLTLGAGKIRKGIRYSLPVKCRVKISLYDFKGSLVQKMMDSDQSAGIYNLQFPGLSSGAYYMLFTAGNFRYSSKLIITK
ncbi:MAG TPA: carbohydrate binding domain-containing protein [Chitinispirillaceae bacterium]|nr:carbohydrate binding domain-containing protein [Chitinispirillaceae bacterium]